LIENWGIEVFSTVVKLGIEMMMMMMMDQSRTFSLFLSPKILYFFAVLKEYS
jgi:hypothetical protein